MSFVRRKQAILFEKRYSSLHSTATISATYPLLYVRQLVLLTVQRRFHRFISKDSSNDGHSLVGDGYLVFSAVQTIFFVSSGCLVYLVGDGYLASSTV
jgi:hypothetical protein